MLEHVLRCEAQAVGMALHGHLTECSCRSVYLYCVKQQRRAAVLQLQALLSCLAQRSGPTPESMLLHSRLESMSHLTERVC